MIWITSDQTQSVLHAAWAKARIGFPGEWGTPFYTLALMDDFAPRCVVVYNGYNPIDSVCNAHIAAIPGKRWITKSFLRSMFEYPFVNSNCRRITLVVKSDNATSINFCEHLGFTREGVMRRGAYDGKDYIIFGMLREECRWIGARHAKRIALAA